jgi:E3 ubiquitin-protein ligase UBR4
LRTNKAPILQKCLAVIEKESENAHKQYQQLVATKKPLLRLISTIGEGLGDQDSPQVAHQVAVPSSTSSTLKVNQSVAVLGVLYGTKCKEAFEQVSRSVETLHGARKALKAYLEKSSPITGEHL